MASGVEYHDLLAAMAPKPQRVFAGVRDPLFPIIGARQAVEEAAAAYGALRAKEPCTTEEHYCVHTCPTDLRFGTYRFFEKALKRPGDVPGTADEGEDIDLADPRLRALPKRPARFRTIGDLYRAELQRVRPKPISAAGLNRLLGRRGADSSASCLVRVDGRTTCRALLRTADGALVPLVLRKGRGGRVTVVMSDAGKDGALARMADRRGPVAAFDWRGQGETAPPEDEWYQRASHYLAYGGETLAGGRVTDLIAAVRWLRRGKLAVERVIALGPEASLIALMAATAERSLPRVELRGLLRTFRDAPGLIGQVKYTAWVPGLATVTDIPQMLNALGERVAVRGWLKPGEEKPREGYT